MSLVVLGAARVWPSAMPALLRASGGDSSVSDAPALEAERAIERESGDDPAF